MDTFWEILKRGLPVGGFFGYAVKRPLPRDKNSITFCCGCATIITHLKTVLLIECFIMLGSLCILHYLVFAKLMALP